MCKDLKFLVLNKRKNINYKFKQDDLLFNAELNFRSQLNFFYLDKGNLAL